MEVCTYGLALPSIEDFKYLYFVGFCEFGAINVFCAVRGTSTFDPSLVNLSPSERLCKVPTCSSGDKSMYYEGTVTLT